MKMIMMLMRIMTMIMTNDDNVADNGDEDDVDDNDYDGDVDDDYER